MPLTLHTMAGEIEKPHPALGQFSTELTNGVFHRLPVCVTQQCDVETATGKQPLHVGRVVDRILQPAYRIIRVSNQQRYTALPDLQAAIGKQSGRQQQA
jgi:hypothetical protein